MRPMPIQPIFNALFVAITELPRPLTVSGAS
jgi:hypothetical protein